jgi:hypothetical protein
MQKPTTGKRAFGEKRRTYHCYMTYRSRIVCFNHRILSLVVVNCT